MFCFFPAMLTVIADKTATTEGSNMNIISTVRSADSDCKLCVASIAGIYAPLLLILSAAALTI